MNNPYVIAGNATVLPSNTLINFCSVNPAPGAIGWGTLNDAVRFYLWKPTELSHFTIDALGDPGVGKSWNIELALYDTTDTEVAALSATISNGVLTASCTTGTRMRAEPGYYVVIRSTPSGSPATLTRLSWAFVCDSLGAPFIQLPIAGVNPSITLDRYLGVFSGQYTPVGSVGPASIGRCSVPIRVKALYANTRDAPGSGNQWVYTLYVNGASTGVTVTHAGLGLHAETTGLDILIPADAEVYYLCRPTSSPTLTYHMLTMLAVPQEPGHYPVSVSTGAVSNAANGYSRAFSTYTNTAATDANPRNITPANLMLRLKQHRCRVSTNPGGVGKAWDNRLRQSGNNLNSLVTIPNGSTSASDLTNVDSLFGPKKVSLQIAPVSTPAAITEHYYSMASYVAPACPLML